MLKATLHLGDNLASVVLPNDGLNFSHNFIEPYKHSLVRFKSFRYKKNIIAWVCEARNTDFTVSSNMPSKIENKNHYDCVIQNVFMQLEDNGGTFILIEVSEIDSGLKVKLTCGVELVAPVYYNLSNGILNISWDFAALIDVSPPVLDKNYIAALLSRNIPYTDHTVLLNVRQLTERSVITFVKDKTQVSYPVSYSRPQPRSLKQGNDAAEIFSEIIEERLLSYPLTSSQLAIELSGGLDSTTVAVALSRIGYKPDTTAVILSGKVGESQALRRQAIIREFGSSDYPIYAEDFTRLIFHPIDSGFDADIFGEIYSKPFGAAWDKVTEIGKTVLLGGYGGDELFLGFGHELMGEVSDTQRTRPEYLLPEWRSDGGGLGLPVLPQPVLPISTLIALSNHSQSLLQRGLWPLHPLTDPKLNRFCSQLSRKYIRLRKLQRMYISRIPSLSFFSKNYTKESFRPLAWESFKRSIPLICEILSFSRLASEGLIDSKKSIEIVQKLNDINSSIFDDILFLINTEYMVQSIKYGRKTTEMQSQIRRMYDPVARVQPVTAGVNHTVKVFLHDQVAYARMYRKVGRTEADITAEINILKSLHNFGVPVSLPLPQKNGNLIQSYIFDNSQRYLSLFTAAEGRPLEYTQLDLFQFGCALAKLHIGADQLGLQAPRNLASQLDQNAFLLVSKRLKVHNELYMVKIIDSLRKFVKESPTMLIKSFCHGDAWLGNARIFDSKVTFFDFDDTVNGPKAFDLSTIIWWIARMKPEDWPIMVRSMLNGYCSHTQLDVTDPEVFSNLICLNEVKIINFLVNNDLLSESLWNSVVDDYIASFQFWASISARQKLQECLTGIVN